MFEKPKSEVSFDFDLFTMDIECLIIVNDTLFYLFSNIFSKALNDTLTSIKLNI